MLAGNILFRSIIGIGKNHQNFGNIFSNVFEYCCMIECFRAIMVIKHDFLIHLHLLGPSGGVETHLSGSGFITFLWAKQM